MLCLYIVPRVFAVFPFIPIVECSTVGHEDAANQMRTVEPDLNIVLIIETEIGEDCQSCANHIWVVGVVGYHKLVKEDLDDSKISQLYQDVEVVSGSCNCSKSLEATQDALFDEVGLR